MRVHVCVGCKTKNPKKKKKKNVDCNGTITYVTITHNLTREG